MTSGAAETAAPSVPAAAVVPPPAESLSTPLPSASVPAKVKPAHAASPLAQTAGAAKPNVPAAPVCSAVPYLDAEGNTHFKQVCR